jgi:hypothetical protein
MKETLSLGSDSEEESENDMPQDMDLEEITVDLPLWEAHGDQKINNLTISQLRKLKRDMVKGKVVGNSQGMTSSISEIWESRPTPLRHRRRSP